MDCVTFFKSKVSKLMRILATGTNRKVSTIGTSSFKIFENHTRAHSNALEIEVLVELEGGVVPISHEGASGCFAKLIDHQFRNSYKITKKL